jgi:hypothetical protein
MYKMFYLSETDWRNLIVEIIDDLGYDEVSKKNINQIATIIDDMISENNLDGMLVWISGELYELWTLDDIVKLLKNYYELK